VKPSRCEALASTSFAIRSFVQRACAACWAMDFRRSGERFAARFNPPFDPPQLAQCNSYRIFGLPWLWKRDQSGFGGRPGTVQYRPYWTLLARFKMSFVNAFAA